MLVCIRADEDKVFSIMFAIILQILNVIIYSILLRSLHRKFKGELSQKNVFVISHKMFFYCKKCAGTFLSNGTESENGVKCAVLTNQIACFRGQCVIDLGHYFIAHFTINIHIFIFTFQSCPFV
jgi:hypothetical protein